MKIIAQVIFLVLALLAGEAMAATCTSKASGNWNSSGTWNCTSGSTPAAGDTVILASPYTVTLNGNYTAASLTINSGATLSDTNQNTLTVTGNITNNGIFTSSNSGVIASTGAGAVISGTGTFANKARLYTSGTTVSIAAGSTLTFTGSAQIRAGRDANGNTVSGSVLTINGTLNGSGLTSGSTFIRLYASSTIVGSTGVITAGTASIQFRATGTLTNNGSVTIGTINRDSGTGTWTNAANSSLTVNTAFSTSSLTLNASATGNTVTFNSPATPITPSGNTYYNLAGTGVVCPVSYTILGTSPCAASLYVQGSPTSCTNVTGVGTVAWVNPANAYSSNNVYATASNVIRNTTTNYLNCTGFNLNAPSGATVSGITMYVERKTSGGTIKDAYVYLIKGGAISTALNGSTATSYPTTDAIETHGGQTNLWGTTWTAADVNASNFGVAFAAKNTSTTSTSNRTVSVDHIQIRVDYTLPALHHIRIEHDGAASTCATESITLKACANAACTSYYTGGDVTNVGLSPTGGSYTWAPGSTVSITAAGGGINSGITLARTSTGTAALAITGTANPAPANAYDCYNTATATSGAGGSAACNLVFSSNSFSFNVPDHTAATKQAVTMTSCTSGFANQTRSVKFWSTYVNPATGTLQGKIVAGGAGNADCATGYSNLGTASGSSTTLSLAFGAGTAPQATFSLCYPDVGSVKLDAQYNGSVATGDNGVVITGNDYFIAKPDHFAVSNINRTSDNLANPAAADAAGSAFIAAGDATVAATRFTVTVTAMNALNAATPNYGLESVPGPEGVVLTVNTPIVAPIGGAAGLLTCSGSTTGCVVAGGAASFSSGATTITDLAWNEVGVMRIMTRIGDGDYLGTSEVTTPTASGNIGRFYPHHFGVTPDASAPVENRSDICAGGVLVADGVTPCTSPAFTYMREQMNAQFTLTAQAASGTTTSNYLTSATVTDNFAKLDPTAASNATPGNTLGFGAVDSAAPTYLSARLDTSLSPSGSFNVGVANIVAPIGITRGGAADGPYAALSIGVAPADSDGVTADVALFDLGTTNVAVLDHVTIGSTEVRYGRMKITNAAGSELLPLPVSLTAQYWDGAAYVTNLDDNNTVLDIANIVLDNYQRKSGDNWTTTLALPNGTASSGTWACTLSRPGGTISGSGSVNITTNAPTYLPSIAGRATFGVYKGNNNFIYLRENY